MYMYCIHICIYNTITCEYIYVYLYTYHIYTQEYKYDMFVACLFYVYIQVYAHIQYGVATISRLLQIIGLFCKRAI